MGGWRHVAALSGCCLVTFALGSVHAFSVLIDGLEQSRQLTRASVSLVYSAALVCLTVAVLTGWRIYHRAHPAVLVMLACGMAAAGLFVAATREGYAGLLIGYGLLFGTANGLGYGFVLQLSARIPSVRAGTAMALVTASYALGATGFAWILSGWVADAGITGALARQALMLLGCGCLAALLVGVSGVRYRVMNGGDVGVPLASGIARFWWVYACNVFAGLMVIGHAAGIVSASGGDAGRAALGVVLIGLGNALGGLAAGAWSRRLAPDRSLVAMPALTFAALVGMLVISGPAAALAGLCLAGFAYGASIAIFPAAILSVYGADGPRVYGRVFTAWGAAGLAGPWLAGGLFQLSGDYTLSIAVAAVFALVSAAMVRRLPLVPGRPA